jgi:hypothetical protein
MGFFSKFSSGFAFGLGMSFAYSLFGLIKHALVLCVLLYIVVYVMEKSGAPAGMQGYMSSFQWVMGQAVVFRDWFISVFPNLLSKL